MISGLCLVIVLALGLVFAYNVTSVPDPNTDFQTQTTKVYYAGGKASLGTFVDQNRESIAYSKMPKSLRDAVISAEDRSFWTNQGIDPKGILRAAFSNASGNATQGASTITQQYVKILYLTSQRTYTRKLKEALVSLKLQKQQSKREILKGYLNTIYFGRGAYGVQAAAQAYFRKDADQLNVRQSAVLASVLNSPGNLDPADGESAQQRLLSRYRYVLAGMAKMGNLDPDLATRYEQRLPVFPKIPKSNRLAGQKGFMLQMIRDELKTLHFTDSQIDGGGLRITTTFSKKYMADMQKSVEDDRPTGLKGLHTGAVSIDVKTGAVRAIYGGQDYLKSSFNWAEAGAQPGSTFKAFALAAGIKAGFSLKDTFDGNSPLTLDDANKTEIKNEGSGDGTSYGSAVNLIRATEESINTAFVDMTQSMPNGGRKILAMADAMGIPVDKTSLQPNLGISLGSERVGMLDMANGYATIANAGKEHPWFVVQKVSDADGKVLYRARRDDTQVLDPDIAADVSYALQQVVSNGTGTAAQAIDRDSAGKTGTATAGDDGHVSSSWYIGYTPQLVTAVMYVRGDGNDQLDGWLPGPYGYFGAGYPAHTWADIMSGELEDVDDDVKFPDPVYVDGTAPSSGHAPYTPPPPSKKPKKTKTPRLTSTPSATPTSAAPTTAAPTTAAPTTAPPTTAPPVTVTPTP
ncbi:penicillin-binding protein [Nocardioides mangrovicus]|uniref:Penicillin-binding protein n=1 Tax=Nocardioides mangrovicus TaxID=2478913 RepID=A0A3L8NZ30_9ACTN|nr:penicillin-binding protein [Nocardioides mangrovicus]